MLGIRKECSYFLTSFHVNTDHKKILALSRNLSQLGRHYITKQTNIQMFYQFQVKHVLEYSL